MRPEGPGASGLWKGKKGCWDRWLLYPKLERDGGLELDVLKARLLLMGAVPIQERSGTSSLGPRRRKEGRKEAKVERAVKWFYFLEAGWGLRGEVEGPRAGWGAKGTRGPHSRFRKWM